MKQKSLIGLLSTVAVVVGMWACGDSSSTEPDDTASSSSSSEEKSISSESSTKDEKSESSSSIEISSSSTESSSSSKTANSSDKTESSSSSEVSSSSNESESSSSSELSSSSDEAESGSSSSDEEIIDCSGKTGLDTLSATLVKVEEVVIRRIYNLSVMVDGKKRKFVMTVPEAYKGDKPVPLIVDYHAIGGSGSGQYNSTTYKTQTEPEGVISLYPDGTAMKEPKTQTLAAMPGWNVGPCCSDDNDVDFTREMIAAVEEMVCIDKKRVYATGFSMGGGMAHQAACSMSDIFAAVATAGMDLNKTNSAKCEPERPIPVIMFRGTGDPVCHYQGGDSGYNDGLNFLGAEGSFRFWAEKDGCTGEPTTNSDGCEEYSNCMDGTKVVLCINKGTPNKEGETNGHSQGDATIGWPFLKQFTLP